MDSSNQKSTEVEFPRKGKREKEKEKKENEEGKTNPYEKLIKLHGFFHSWKCSTHSKKLFDLLALFLLVHIHIKGYTIPC